MFPPRDVAEASSTGSDQDLAVLKGQAESLQAALSQMRKRIEELEGKPEEQ
jgi:hypothetical protein